MSYSNSTIIEINEIVKASIESADLYNTSRVEQARQDLICNGYSINDRTIENIILKNIGVNV